MLSIIVWVLYIYGTCLLYIQSRPGMDQCQVTPYVVFSFFFASSKVSLQQGFAMLNKICIF